MKHTYYLLTLCLLMLSATVAIAQPANDNCSGAQSLGTLPSPPACGSSTKTKNGTPVTVTGTNVGATSELPYPYINACGTPSTSNPPVDVWYSFVASSYQAAITITGATFTNPTISVYEGTCTSLLGVGCASGAGGTVTDTIVSLTPGTTYYIQVAGSTGSQTGTFTLTTVSETDCANCLTASTITATPPPVNGTYGAGVTVTFCDNITNYNQTSSNWLHGVTPSFGSGWDLTTLVPGTGPPACTSGGTWSWYPQGDSSWATHDTFGPGFYYETAATGTIGPGVIDGYPGDNYGDDNLTGTCTWNFCVTITTKASATCTAGSDLDVQFLVTGDGQSGSWTSVACTHDPIGDLYVVGACCPPIMTYTQTTCTNPDSGTATATPAGTNGPWTNGTTQTGLTGQSTITGLAVGTDTVTVTDASNCKAIATVTITGPVVNGGPDQTVSCVTLPGGSATMAAIGTGTWTAVAGNPGTATITTPTSPTTTITNFSAPGTYNFKWTVSGCSSGNISVVVTAKPNAGPDKTLSCVALPGGSVTMSGTGTGTWTALAGNPGTATITTPTSPTTTITTFSAAGTYKFKWTNGTCTDTADVVVTAKPNAGPDQTVTCYPAGNSATMAATGTGTWTAQTGNPGTATITTPTSPTTTITTFSSAGTYNFIWTSGGCTDTAAVIVTAKPNAGPDEAITCFPINNATTMAGTGTGTWTAETGNPGTATITTPTSPTTTITAFSAIGTYKFIWTNGGCSDTADVVVTGRASAGTNQTVSCITLPGGSAIMAATGTGTWTAQTGNPGTATITTPTSPTTTITTFSSAGTYNFIWTSGGCTDTAAVIVTAKPNAGPDQTVTCFPINSAATMAGTGTGTWTAQTGNPGTATITTPTLPTTTITAFSIAGTYNFIWTSGGCTDTAAVIVTTKPNAGPDQTVSCINLPGGSATMAGTGTGTWAAQTGNPGTATITAPTSPTTTITTFTAAGTYNFIWTGNGGCSDTAAVTVTAKPNAGADQTITCAVLPGGTATMAATGTGTWTAQTGNPGTATITTPGSATTTITTFSAAGTYKFIWTNASGCTDTADVVVTAKPNAGPDQTVSCALLPGGSATMAGTGTGTWTAEAGNPGTATITTPTSPTTIIHNFSIAGTYYFIWTNASGCSDTAAVTVTAKPSAGPDQTVSCIILPGGSATMAATGTGTWTALATNPGTSTITSSISPTTTITTFSSAGTYNYVWTSGGCTDTAAVIVTAKPNAGPDQTINCAVLPGGSATMAATGTGTWTAEAGNPGTATITTPTSATTVIHNFSTAGTYNFIWTSGGCTDTASVIVTAKPNAGPDQTVSCVLLPGGSATMAATGTGTWTALASNPGTSTITIPGSATTTITTFSTAGTYDYIWTNGSGCTDTAAVIVTAKANAGPDQTISCAVLPGGSATMAATGIGIWTAQAGNPGTASITTPGSATTTITTFGAAGTYNFIWTSGGCTDTASVIVTAKPNAGPDQSICENTTATMAATGTGTWSAIPGNPATTTITNPTQTNTTITGFSVVGTYSFEWTSSAGCTDTMNLTVKPLPTPTVTNDTICAGSNGVLTASGGVSYVWSNAATTPSITVTAAGTYTVTATGANTCSATASGTLTVNQIPTPTVNNASICAGNNATLTATGGVSYIWSTTATTPSITVSTAGTYTVTATGANGCTASATGTVTVNQLPVPTVTDASICSGNSGTLTASGGVSYVWSTSATTPSITVSTAGTYTVTATNAAGCTASASGTVTVNALPTPSVNDSTVCAGNSAILTASGGVSYTWNTGATTPSITVSTAGTYTVTATNASGCTATASGTLTVNPLPTPTVNNATVCAGNSATLIATGGVSYIWNTSAITPSITVSTAGTYTVTATGVNGCTASATGTLTVDPLPTPAVNDASVCSGNSATLTATGGVSYVWSTSATTPSITVTTAGTYTVTATGANGCTATASGTVTVNALPTPTVNDSTVCAGNSAILTATGGVSYVWSTSATTPGITVSIAGTYTVTATNANGCTATASGTLNVNPLPTVTVNNASACVNDSAVLIATGNAASYVWSTTATGTAIVVYTAGTYTVTATGNDGCTAAASAIFTINPLPTPTVNNASVCTGNNAVLTATGGVSYVWSNSSTTDTIHVDIAGTYTVTATDANGCSATAAGTVIVNPLPTPTVNDSTVCAGDPAILTATGGVSYVWSNAATTPSITVSTAGTYTVTATDANSCSATASGTLTVNPLPTPAVNNAAVCAGDSAVLTVTGSASSYIWSTSSTSTSITVSIAGTYTVTATAPDGCTAAATGVLTVNPLPTPTVNNETVCEGNYATLTATGGIGYVWNNAATTASITDSTAGTYTVTVTDGNGCSATASGTITVTPKPYAGVDTTICQNGIAGLNGLGIGIWSALPNNPVSTTIASPNSPSTSISGYTVAGNYGYVWTVNGCTDTAFVKVNASPVLAPTVTNITCTNAVGVINANASGSSPFTYQWSTTSTGDSIHTTTSGTPYSVTVTDINQCTASATSTVGNLIIIVGVTGVPTNVSCYGYSDGSVVLTVTPAGQYTYAWSNSETTGSITGLQPGTYNVTVTDTNGCVGTAGPFVITTPSADTLMVTPLDTNITLGDTVQLNSTLTGAYPGATYTWTPSTGLSCTNCPDPVLIPVDTFVDTYKLIITYNNGCLASDSAIVKATADDVTGLPTAFTPNGDGKNDVFVIRAIGVKDFKMNIYNRWGEQVFSTTDINVGWDGNYKGSPQPSEAYTYFFTLGYLDGKVITHEGSFMLLR